MPHHHRLHEHDEQRVQLGAEVGPRKLVDDFRCGVLGGAVAEELRETGVTRCDAQAEIGQNAVSVLPDKDVVALDIPLDETGPVQHVNSSQDAGQNPEEGGGTTMEWLPRSRGKWEQYSIDLPARTEKNCCPNASAVILRKGESESGMAQERVLYSVARRFSEFVDSSAERS